MKASRRCSKCKKRFRSVAEKAYIGQECFCYDCALEELVNKTRPCQLE